MKESQASGSKFGFGMHKLGFRNDG